MVLLGKVSWTAQSALGAHGLISRHGFLQSPWKHASLLGHSASNLQPGSGGGGTGRIHRVSDNTKTLN